jgi:hypothetical protein
MTHKELDKEGQKELEEYRLVYTAGLRRGITGGIMFGLALACALIVLLAVCQLIKIVPGESYEKIHHAYLVNAARR